MAQNPFDEPVNPFDQAFDPAKKKKVEAAPAPISTLERIRQDPAVQTFGQFGGGIMDFLKAAPGIPADLLQGYNNYVAPGLGMPHMDPKTLEGQIGGLGSAAFKDRADRAQIRIGELIGQDLHESGPKNEAERVARKFGNFFIGGGPRGVGAGIAGLLGSEAGRATDKAGWTGGYGETAGGILGPIAKSVVGQKMFTHLEPTEAPTPDELTAFAKGKYREADQAGVLVAPQAVKDLHADALQELAKVGYRKRNQPRIKNTLAEIEQAGQIPNTFEDLDQIRRGVLPLAKSQDGVERMMAGKIISAIDKAMTNVDPAHVLGGNSAQGAAAYKAARDAWLRMSKNKIVEKAKDIGELNAATSGVGGNVDNTLRQQFKAIVKNEGKFRQFRPDEQKMIRGIAEGGSVQNMLRHVARFSPTAGTLPLSAEIMGLLTHQPWAIPGAVAGYAAKAFGDAATKGAVARLSERVLRGTPAPPPPGLLQMGGKAARYGRGTILPSLMQPQPYPPR